MNADIKHIIVIESLGDAEQQTGTALYEDTISPYKQLLGDKSPIITHSFHKVITAQELLDLLDAVLAGAANLQNGLVIHFEMHGSAALDGLVTASHELVSWQQLVEKFRAINVATANELYLTLATCYGRHLYLAVDPEQKSPYRGYLSASQAVFVWEVMESFTDVYSRLMNDGNLIRSYLESDAEGGRFFYKDSEETFRQLMELTFDRMQNDPAYREELFDHPMLIEAQQLGILNDELMNAMMHMAFRDIYERHKKAFEFDV